MFNLVKDDYDKNTDDILNSINKMLEKNKKGKLFVIEGTDGSGKQTQFERLQKD